jgi:Tfp pilus assembly protein PilO
MATLGTVAAAVELAYLPMKAESARLAVERLDVSAFLKTAEQIDQHNSRLKQELSDLDSQLARLNQKIPDAPQEADFLAQLAAAADKSHIEIRDYRPAGVSHKQRHSELVIHVSANGTYTGLCQFLEHIENLPRLCHVTALDVDAEKAATEPYSIILTLRVFFAPDRRLNRMNSATEKKNG